MPGEALRCRLGHNYIPRSCAGLDITRITLEPTGAEKILVDFLVGFFS